MAVYYNEIEPYAAQWLRNLIAKGLLPDGEVDERSIVDVRPDDLRGFAQAHFFAGIGGWPYALRLAGWPDDRPVWTGSCPCQPFSVAGKGLGADDPRHLWPHFHRLIAACRPPVVFGEQVAGAAGYGWLDGVRSDLAREGYACEAFDIPAVAVDAPHIRSRLYWVASALDHANDARLEGHAGDGDDRPGRASAAGSVAATGGGDVADSDSGGRADERGARLWRAGVHDADGRGQRDGGDMADADRRQSRAGRSDDGEVRGLSEAQRQPEHGAAVSAGSGSTDGGMADADNQSVRGEGHAGVAGTASADAGKAREREWVRTDAVADGEHRRNGTFWSDAVWLTGADGKARRAQPGLSLLAHGVSGGVAVVRPGAAGQEETHVYSRVGALRAFGNAIVPQLAAEIITAFMETGNAANTRP